jgi:hypothetical protein
MKAVTVGLVAVAAAGLSRTAAGQSAQDYLGPAAVVPLQTEQPAPKLVVDPPQAQALARGLVVIQYRAENLRIVPVYGPDALDVSPRIGHLHITLDDAPWHWVDASGEPIIVQFLPPGPHKILVELANANHNILDRHVVSFVIPAK